jgi:DNA-binding NarL/FixJ family response regulator
MILDTSPMKVLLVEDSLIVRQRIEELLSSIPGVAVVGHAEDASDAIAAIQHGLPDLVVLDVRLRKSTGADVLRYVLRACPRVKVIVLSNESSRAVRAFFMGLGAHAFFDKALEFDQLRAVITDLAAHRS